MCSEQSARSKNGLSCPPSSGKSGCGDLGHIMIWFLLPVLVSKIPPGNLHACGPDGQKFSSARFFLAQQLHKFCSVQALYPSSIKKAAMNKPAMGSACHMPVM